MYIDRMMITLLTAQHAYFLKDSIHFKHSNFNCWKRQNYSKHKTSVFVVNQRMPNPNVFQRKSILCAFKHNFHSSNFDICIAIFLPLNFRERDSTHNRVWKLHFRRSATVFVITLRFRQQLNRHINIFWCHSRRNWSWECDEEITWK